MCDTQERLGTSGPLDQVRAGNVTGELKAVLDAGSINGRPGEQSPVETGCSYGERSADPKGCRCQRRAVKVKTVSRVETDRPLHPTGYAALRWSGSPVHNTHPSPSGDEGIVQPPAKVGDRCPAGSTFTISAGAPSRVSTQARSYSAKGSPGPLRIEGGHQSAVCRSPESDHRAVAIERHSAPIV